MLSVLSALSALLCSSSKAVACCVLMLFACQMPLTAQQKDNGVIPWYPESFHRIYLWGSLGQSTLNVDLEKTSFVGRTGGNVGLAYSYTLRCGWSVSAGLELALLRTSTKPYSFAYSSSWIDSEGDPFTMKYLYNGYQEQLCSRYLNVPISVGYAYQRLYLAVGAKTGVHLRSSYVSSINPLKTTADYPQFIGDLENIPNRYLVNRLHRARGSVTLGTNAMVSVELGATLMQRSGEPALRLAAFCDYGVSSVLRSSAKKDLVEYGKLPTDIQLSSILESEAYGHRATLSMVGVKLTYLLASKPVGRRYKCNCTKETFLHAAAGVKKERR